MREKLIPANRGGGVGRGEPTARINKYGVLSMSSRAMEILGNPPKLEIWIVDNQWIELFPTTATDKGGWKVSGGNGTSAQVRAREVIKRLGAECIGAKLAVSKVKGGAKIVPSE